MQFHNPTNDFALTVEPTDQFSFWPEGSEFGAKFRQIIRNGHTYYAVPHRSEYRVKMRNNTKDRVNATLVIDGEDMGRWRIEPYTDITIERPSHSQRKFTFVSEASSEAVMGGVVMGNSMNGLIEVTFVPEIVRRSFGECDGELQCSRKYTWGRPKRTLGDPMMNSAMTRDCFNESLSYSAGATVLGNNSEQQFGSAQNIIEDNLRKVTKRIRLIVDESDRPYCSIKSSDDPIPPPINRF